MHLRLPFRLDPNTFSALKSRNFAIFLSGQSAAMTGLWVQKLANSWLVYRLTESPLKLGLIELLANAPIFIVGLLAGAYLDKHDKRKTLMTTQFLTMMHAVIMAVLVLTDTVNYYFIMVLSLYLGIVSAIDMPTRQSSILLMVESRKDLKSALALQSMTFNLSRLIGPSIAGFIVYYVGEGFCFLLTAVLYLPVLFVLYRIRFNEMPHDKSKKQSMIKDVAEGLKYVKNFYSLRTMFMFLAVFGLCSYSYTVMFPIFAKDILHGNSRLLGLLMGLFGFGAIIGAFSVASIMRLERMPKPVVKVSLLYALSLSVFAISPYPVLSMLVVIPAGLGLVATFISTNTLLQTISSVEMRSRVISIYTIVNLGFGPIGCFLAGTVTEHIPPQATMLIWCFIMMMASLFLFYNMKKINKEVRPIIKDLDKIN